MEHHLDGAPTQVHVTTCPSWDPPSRTDRYAVDQGRRQRTPLTIAGLAAAGARQVVISRPTRSASRWWRRPLPMVPGRRWGAHVLHLHLRSVDDLFLLAPLGLASTAPVVVHLQGSVSRPALTGQAGSWHGRLLGAPTEAALLRRALRVFAPCEGTARLAQQVGGAPVVIPPVAVPPPAVPAETPRPMPTITGRRIVAVGPLVARRRPTDLVRALAPQPPNTHLLFLGDGPQAPRIRAEAERRAIAARVHIAPTPTWTDLIAHLHAADVVVGAVAHGDDPDPLLQAMRLGRPLIATRGGGRERLVSHGVDGVLVAAGALWELAGAIRRLLTDAPLATELGATAERRSASRGWGDVGAEILGALPRERPRPLSPPYTAATG